MSKKLYLVTGGAGFIGSNIAAELLRQGQRVRVIDNLSTGRQNNIASFLEQIEFVNGDIRDADLVREVVRGVDYILHQAALPSVPRSIVDPSSSNQVNIQGTLNLLIAAKEMGVAKFVFASSSSVYGENPKLPKEEDFIPNPLSPYALTKLTGESYCRLFHQLFGVKTVMLRYFNVFGLRQNPKSQYAAVIPKFILALMRKEAPTIYGDGEQSRDFTYVDNVVWANIAAANNADLSGEVINLATGNQVTVNQLYQKLSEILGVTLSPIYAPPRQGDIKHSYAGIAKAKKLLGYQPLVAFEAGLEKTVNWFLDNERTDKKS